MLWKLIIVLSVVLVDVSGSCELDCVDEADVKRLTLWSLAGVSFITSLVSTTASSSSSSSSFFTTWTITWNVCHLCKKPSFDLRAHNWQKWKRVFLTCPCHKIYRDEAVGLKSCKYTWKITIFVKMWNLGQYRENLIFCQ